MTLTVCCSTVQGTTENYAIYRYENIGFCSPIYKKNEHKGFRIDKDIIIYDMPIEMFYLNEF